MPRFQRIEDEAAVSLVYQSEYVQILVFLSLVVPDLQDRRCCFLHPCLSPKIFAIDLIFLLLGSRAIFLLSLCLYGVRFVCWVFSGSIYPVLACWFSMISGLGRLSLPLLFAATFRSDRVLFFPWSLLSRCSPVVCFRLHRTRES